MHDLGTGTYYDCRGIEAETLANYIDKVCNVKLSISRPIDWQWYVTSWHHVSSSS